MHLSVRYACIRQTKDFFMTNVPIVPIAFEIIIQHISGDTVPQSRTEIYNRVLKVFNAYVDRRGLPEHVPGFNFDSVKRTVRYLKDFGLVEKLGTQTVGVSNRLTICALGYVTWHTIAIEGIMINPLQFPSLLKSLFNTLAFNTLAVILLSRKVHRRYRDTCF